MTPCTQRVVCSKNFGCGVNMDKPSKAQSAGLPPPLPPGGSGASLGCGAEGIKVGVLVGVTVGVLVGGGVKLPSLIDFGGFCAKTWNLARKSKLMIKMRIGSSFFILIDYYLYTPCLCSMSTTSTRSSTSLI